MKLISATSGGRQGEAVRYSAYGVPFLIVTGDLDGDGDRDLADFDYMDDMVNGFRPYSVVGDLDLDGDVDFTDSLLVAGSTSAGRGLLSDTTTLNRRGYAGYEHDAAIDAICHVRHRVYLTELGRWTRRDPLGWVDGMSLYEYVRSAAVTGTDALGLFRFPSNIRDLGNPFIRSIDLEDEGGGPPCGGTCIEDAAAPICGTIRRTNCILICEGNPPRDFETLCDEAEQDANDTCDAQGLPTKNIKTIRCPSGCVCDNLLPTGRTFNERTGGFDHTYRPSSNCSVILQYSVVAAKGEFRGDCKTPAVIG